VSRYGLRGTERSTVFMAARRRLPSATATLMLAKRARDSSTHSPAAFMMRQRHPLSLGVQTA